MPGRVGCLSLQVPTTGHTHHRIFVDGELVSDQKGTTKHNEAIGPVKVDRPGRKIDVCNGAQIAGIMQRSIEDACCNSDARWVQKTLCQTKLTSCTPSIIWMQIRVETVETPSWAEGNLPTSIKEKETHWLKRDVNPLHRKAGTKRGSGVWRVAGSTRLWNLAVSIILVFNSTPGGYKYVGVLYRRCIEFTCKPTSSLVIELFHCYLCKDQHAAAVPPL
eukprot:302227-Pelagomonas_calceolata.AAC.1